MAAVSVSQKEREKKSETRLKNTERVFRSAQLQDHRRSAKVSRIASGATVQRQDSSGGKSGDASILDATAHCAVRAAVRVVERRCRRLGGLFRGAFVSVFFSSNLHNKKEHFDICRAGPSVDKTVDSLPVEASMQVSKHITTSPSARTQAAKKFSSGAGRRSKFGGAQEVVEQVDFQQLEREAAEKDKQRAEAATASAKPIVSSATPEEEARKLLVIFFMRFPGN